MARLSLAFLAVASAFALFGGLHIEASGRGLERHAPGDARLVTGTTIAAAGINRAAKTDRTAPSPGTSRSHTIIFQHPSLPATTVAVQLWETARIKPAAPPKEKQVPAGKRKQAVACEGAVSVLSEVAKHLDASRCIT